MNFSQNLTSVGGEGGGGKERGGWNKNVLAKSLKN